MALPPILRAHMHYRCKRPTAAASSVGPTVPLPLPPSTGQWETGWRADEGDSAYWCWQGGGGGGRLCSRTAHFIFNSFSRRTSAAAFHLPFVYFANWVSSRLRLPSSLSGSPTTVLSYVFPQIKQKTQPKKKYIYVYMYI